MVNRFLGIVAFFFALENTNAQMFVFSEKYSDSFRIVYATDQSGLREYRIGYSPGGARIFRIERSDTLEIFRSFGCTQLAGVGSLLRIYIWLNNFHEGDCICIEEENRSCVPELKSADLVISYSLEHESLRCSVGNLNPVLIDTMAVEGITSYFSECRSRSFFRNIEKGNVVDSVYLDYIGFAIIYYWQIYYYCNILNPSKKIEWRLINKHMNNYIRKQSEYIIPYVSREYFEYMRVVINRLLPLQGQTISLRVMSEVSKRISMIGH